MKRAFWNTDPIKEKLNGIISEQTVLEEALLKDAEEAGLDLGRTPKTRLTYLVSLGILANPKTIYFGRGQGGTRVFHPDSLDILKFISTIKLSLADTVSIFKDEIERRTRVILEKYSSLYDELYELSCKETLKQEDRFLFMIAESSLFRAQTIEAGLLFYQINTMEYHINQRETEILAFKIYSSFAEHKFCQTDYEQTLEYLSMLEKYKSNAENVLESLYSEAEKVTAEQPA